MTTTHLESEQAFSDLQWPSTGLRVGIEKPVVAPRSPSSLAQQIYPALWGMGNLWLWQPQVRVEQKFTFGGNDSGPRRGFCRPTTAVPFPSHRVLLCSRARHGKDVWRSREGLKATRAIEFAPGFHYSRTLASGTSVPSQLITGDWRIAPSHQWELTGAFFTGRNAGPIGGLRQGIVIVEPGSVRSVATTGGWSQLMYRPFDRLRFHVMAGQQDDRDSDLVRGAVGRNFSWIVNSMLQVSPNVLVGLKRSRSVHRI